MSTLSPASEDAEISTMVQTEMIHLSSFSLLYGCTCAFVHFHREQVSWEVRLEVAIVVESVEMWSGDGRLGVIKGADRV